MKSTLALWLFLFPGLDVPRWPGFLGAGGAPVVANTVPMKWTPDQLAWRVTTPGYGQSSPLIWEDRLFVTAVDGPEKETLHVICLSLKSGEILWDATHASTCPQKNSVYISRAAPTPVIDDKGIYAYFESGDIVALSHAGEKMWSRSLSQEFGPPKNEFGLSASPVQLQDRIIVLVDDEGPSYLVAISKTDGTVMWKTDRTSRKSWSSPMLVPVGDTFQLVCSSAGSVDGYDTTTGERLWTYDAVGGNSSTSPIPTGSGTFLVGAAPGREGENTDLARKSNGLFLVEKSATGWAPRFEWTNTSATPSWGSPIMHQGYAYWVNRSGAVYCLNANTGETIYTKRLKQSCWATPVAIGDHIYFFGKDGLTTVLKAGPEFEVVAENPLWTEEDPPVNRVPAPAEETEERQRNAAMFSRPTLYGVAIVDGFIVIRTGSQVFCVHSTDTPRP